MRVANVRFGPIADKRGHGWNVRFVMPCRYNSFHFSTQVPKARAFRWLSCLTCKGSLVMGTSLGDKIAIVIALLLLAVGGVMIVEFPGIIRAALLVATL